MNNIGKENSTTEFKESTSQLSKGVISMAAMLNKSGKAIVYFGVRDNGDVCGQAIGKNTLKDISHAIIDNIEPKIIPDIEPIETDGKTYIKVTAEGHEIPYAAYGSYYVRSTDENKQVTSTTLRKMFLLDGTDPLKKTVSSDHNLHFTQLSTLLLSGNIRFGSAKSFVGNEGLLAPNGKFNFVAKMMSDESEISIKTVQFVGNDKSEMISRNEHGYCSLALALNSVIEYAKAKNETFVKLGAGPREEQTLFDDKCFKEAWVNACLHTDWLKGFPPVVYFFKDRVEITSFGGLPYGLDKKEFLKGKSVVVNKALHKIFVQLNYAEETGYGVPTIRKKYGAQAFEITDTFITVTLQYTRPLVLITNNRRLKDKISGLNVSEVAVLKAIKANSHITIVKLTEQTELSKRAVNYIIRKLRNKNVITRKGAKKTGTWIIID